MPNDVVKTLAEKAGAKFIESRQLPGGGVLSEYWDYEKFEIEVFAELIVKECVEKLKETKEVELPLLQAINENIKELPLAVYIVELKGHFGVEHDAC